MRYLKIPKEIHLFCQIGGHQKYQKISKDKPVALCKWRQPLSIHDAPNRFQLASEAPNHVTAPWHPDLQAENKIEKQDPYEHQLFSTVLPCSIYWVCLLGGHSWSHLRRFASQGGEGNTLSKGMPSCWACREACRSSRMLPGHRFRCCSCPTHQWPALFSHRMSSHISHADANHEIWVSESRPGQNMMCNISGDGQIVSASLIVRSCSG